jgi:uncharacterized membrane protein
LAPALAATLVLVIGLPLAALLNIWVDEAYTVHTTGAGIAYALHEARTFELQPPLYFLFLSVWRFANEASIAFARFPSLVFAAAAAALIVLTARRITSSISPTALAVATACNPTIIWAAVEMRVYALVLLIAAMLTFTYFAGFLAPEPSRPAQAVYVAAGIAGLYTQFYVGLVLAAFACVLLFVNRRQIVACILANVAIVVGFLPFVPVALQQFHASSGGDVQRISTLKAFHEIANANFIYLLPHELAWSGAVKTGGFLIAGCLVAAIVLMGRPRLGPSGRTLLLCWALASFFYAFTFAVTGEALDVRRHVIAVAPLALLAGYAVLSGLEKYRRRRWSMRHFAPAACGGRIVRRSRRLAIGNT